jgi:hypothetical protein
MSAVASDFPKTPSATLPTSRRRLSILRRFGKPLLAIALASLACMGLQSYVTNRLGNAAFATGYTLLAVIIALTMLGVRKRLPSANLGPVTVWQTTHHYLGLFCLIAYVSHAGILTNGWLESILAVLFWTILLTGFVSWYVNRSSPQLLRAAGQAILRSDIPEAKIAVAEQAYQLALAAAGSSNAFVIADLYQATLTKFFSSPRSLWYRIFPTGRHRRDLQYQLTELTRYLDERGVQLQAQMIDLVKRRDDLDFQSAIHNRIRFFATIHTLLLGAFIVFTAGHVLVAHLYSSHW